MKPKLLSVSALALRTCLPGSNNVISFETLHKNNKKSTPAQLINYHAAINLYKLLDFDTIMFEIVTILNQISTTTRQLNFEIFRDNRKKIGMNTTANKLYCLSGKVGLLALNLKFLQYKKLMKFQFLKYGKT